MVQGERPTQQATSVSREWRDDQLRLDTRGPVPAYCRMSHVNVWFGVPAPLVQRG